MIRSYLGFDLAEYRDPLIMKGVIYGSLGACAEALPWYLAAFGLPYVLEGGNGALAGAVALALAVAGFLLGVLCKMKAFNANFAAAYTLVAHVRLRLADHLAKLPLGRVHSQRDGAWTELMTTQFSHYQEIVTNFWGYVVAGTAFPLLLWLLLLWLNWTSALVILASLPIALLSVPIAYRLLEHAAEKVTSARQSATVKVLEVVTGARDLRFFDPQGLRQQATLQSLKDLRDASMLIEVAPAPALSLFSFVVYIGAAVAIGTAILQLIDGNGRPAVYFAAVLVTLRLAAAINEYGVYLAVMRFGGMIIRRIRGILAEPAMPQVSQGQHPKDGSIEIQNVSFGYGNTDVVRNVSLRAESGSMIALVGPSGSGKSTIAALTARQWDTRQGCVLIGGVDVRHMDEATLHKTVSMVLQDVVLFPMTVADNIRLGRQDAPLEDVIAAARAACIHERIMQLSKGYETMLESGEVMLSGGERQRVAIARAVLKDAPVLIFDETTSSLDLENETMVQQAIGNLCRGKTTIVIAHRLWTIQDADEIFVLDDGRIAESGTHATLLEHDGLYARLWNAQNDSAT
ncbi:ABC transporter ATP-binding protein [uncultured Desulfovibrio sp.]|uniref:ABC transporter ATP-binding protein n=1 Tax=uncultured Desulfovibrio sp. TaxID=167968 RepID=UPI002624F4C1|nr:ABC transporter ATP-binding protein [uncultured Desulfovibrio sp.]